MQTVEGRKDICPNRGFFMQLQAAPTLIRVRVSVRVRVRVRVRLHAAAGRADTLTLTLPVSANPNPNPEAVPQLAQARTLTQIEPQEVEMDMFNKVGCNQGQGLG